MMTERQGIARVRIKVSPPNEPAYSWGLVAKAAGAVEGARQVQAPGVLGGRCVAGQSVEDHHDVPLVVHEPLIAGQRPGAGDASEDLLAGPPAHVIIDEFELLVAVHRAGRLGDDEPVFAVPGVRARAVQDEVAVAVVAERFGRVGGGRVLVEVVGRIRGRRTGRFGIRLAVADGVVGVDVVLGRDRVGRVGRRPWVGSLRERTGASRACRWKREGLGAGRVPRRTKPHRAAGSQPRGPSSSHRFHGGRALDSR